jgi:hypothetical protein
MPSPARMKEFANLSQRRGDRQSAAQRVPKREDDSQGDQRLADDDQQQNGRDHQRFANKNRWVKKHPNRDEEQHRKGVLQRQRVVRRFLAQIGLVQNHARKKGTQGEGDAEEFRGAKGNPHCNRKDT